MNIQRHASIPNHRSLDALPALSASSASDSSATKMPMVMASCWRDPSAPRYRAGAISAMYAGAITEAMPMPRPPITRQINRSGTDHANPVPMDEAMNSAEPSSITFLRPQMSASRPANQAPSAHPRSAMATAKPFMNELSSKCVPMDSTAPLTTELSKPKRNPPTAAATVTPMTLATCASPPTGRLDLLAAPVDIGGTHLPDGGRQSPPTTYAKS